MAKISVLGVDLGKNVCSVVGLDASGAVVMRRRMRRDGIVTGTWLRPNESRRARLLFKPQLPPANSETLRL